MYKLQGVTIADKHIECIVRQMMRKVKIEDPGDTRFLEKQVVDKNEFFSENDWIYNKKVVIEPGDAEELHRVHRLRERGAGRGPAPASP